MGHTSVQPYCIWLQKPEDQHAEKRNTVQLYVHVISHEILTRPSTDKLFNTFLSSDCGSQMSSQVPALEQVSLASSRSWQARVALNLHNNDGQKVSQPDSVSANIKEHQPR